MPIIQTVRQDTVNIEKKYQEQQRKKRAKKTEKEQLRGRFVAPIILVLSLAITILVWYLAQN